jgi:hypothetical protein
VPFSRKRKEALRIRGEGLACDCFDCGRKFPVRITRSHADRLCTEIKTDKGPAGWQMRGCVGKGKND